VTLGAVSPPCPSRTDAPFVHEAEAHLAELFDRWGVAWEYEPRTFELAWDELGRPTRAFTPDFFLPDHDVYVEITTLRQSLVTKKNAKARETRELYGVDVVVLYRRDYETLLAHFGPAAPHAFSSRPGPF
jgi:hypoxanthine phosphoribosyltransferase